MTVAAVGINHIALEVPDLDAALEWYGRFFAFELRGRRETMAWLDLGDQFLALSVGGEAGAAEGPLRVHDPLAEPRDKGLI